MILLLILVSLVKADLICHYQAHCPDCSLVFYPGGMDRICTNDSRLYTCLNDTNEIQKCHHCACITPANTAEVVNHINVIVPIVILLLFLIL